jgi:hypothetical protein
LRQLIAQGDLWERGQRVSQARAVPASGGHDPLERTAIVGPAKKQDWGMGGLAGTRPVSANDVFPPNPFHDRVVNRW